MCVVAVGTASDVPIITDHGVKINCIINDYLSKEKIVEIPIIIFHPLESRFKGQTTNVRRGSILFFSGEVTFVGNQLYLELHNFSFLRGQNNQAPPKANFMPWLENNSSAPSTSTRTNNAQLIHKQNKSPDSSKHKPFQPNKVTKLADIATNMLAKNVAENENEVNETVREKKVFGSYSVSFNCKHNFKYFIYRLNHQIL